MAQGKTFLVEYSHTFLEIHDKE